LFFVIVIHLEYYNCFCFSDRKGIRPSDVAGALNISLGYAKTLIYSLMPTRNPLLTLVNDEAGFKIRICHNFFFSFFFFAADNTNTTLDSISSNASAQPIEIEAQRVLFISNI
jgi:hypothetical protein